MTTLNEQRASDLAAVLLGEGKYDQHEAAERAGVSLELARQLWRALGFPDVPEGDRTFTDGDVEALAIAGAALANGLVDTDLVLQFTRVMASSMSRVAEAQVGLVPGESLADNSTLVAEGLLWTPRLLDFMWRRHLLAAAQRALLRDVPGAPVAPLAVGFADLVGFTAMSQQLDETSLAAVVDRFASLAYDRVVACGGRVVKMIGDEVMFVVDEARAGAEIALTLAETYAGEAELSDVRVGLAYGDVLTREGDAFGPTVNLASRLVNIARPASVVTSAEVHDLLEDAEGLAWRSMRQRWLKGIGRVHPWVVRRGER